MDRCRLRQTHEPDPMSAPLPTPGNFVPLEHEVAQTPGHDLSPPEGEVRAPPGSPGMTNIVGVDPMQ